MILIKNSTIFILYALKYYANNFMKIRLCLVFFFLIFLRNESFSKDFLVIQSTTSTRDSGFYNYILPKFKNEKGVDARVVAVGTGQAIRNAKNCDGDLLLVHHTKSELEFVDDGYGLYRKEIMFNDYILVGPKSDPANIINEKTIVGALKKIAFEKSNFVSRGDDSGTHKKEFGLWKLTDAIPNAKLDKWYIEVGLGMGEALNIAVNKSAYILTDRATWISFRNKQNHLVIVENKPLLYNFYGIIPMSPERCPKVKFKMAETFIQWLSSDNGKKLINSYKVDGISLFKATK